MPTLTSNPENLNDVMGMYCPVQVRDGVAYAGAPGSPYAPDCYWNGWGEGQHIEPGTGWQLLDGYSGQCGYSGSVMHDSEYIGGNLARDILATDGWYVAVPCETLDDSDNAAGWVVAYRPL